MPYILETERFIVAGHDEPHQPRRNGGHSRIIPKNKYAHRWEMPLVEATEMMQLTMVVGEAVMNVMKKKGIPVVRINYQDNGNWAYKTTDTPQPQVHVHLYVRSLVESHPDNDPRFQSFPEGLIFPPKESGYYDHFEPYTVEDCQDIRAEVIRLLTTQKYQEVTFKVQGIQVK